MKELMLELLKDSELKDKSKDVSRFAARIVDEINRMPQEKRKKILQIGKIDENQILNQVKEFFEKELKAKVYVWEEENKEKYDPKGKASAAMPYRPAIYLE